MSATSTETTPPNSMTSSPSAPIITGLPHLLEIRHNRAEDAPAAAHHGNNRKVWLNMMDFFPHPYTLQEAEKWMAMCLDSSNWIDVETPSSPSILISPNYAITLNGAYIGGIGLKPKTNVHRRTAEFGYWIGEEHWGKGYMTIIVKAFVAWIWETFPELVRLEGVVYAWNPNSGKLLKRAGFERESTKRKDVFKDGHLIDSEVWVHLREGF